MPMNFPDMQSLKHAADVHQFRQPTEGEKEHDYRNALADHVATVDFVESQEIRTSKGWDQWVEADTVDLLMRALGHTS